MKNLISLLGGDKDKDAPESSSMDSDIDAGDAGDDATNEGFDSAAGEMFDALESKDVASFTDALKTCLEMYK